MPKSRHCPNCGYINAEAAIFCGNCGGDLRTSPPTTSIRCPSCETLNTADAIFCGNCGSSLRGISPSHKETKRDRRLILPSLLILLGLVIVVFTTGYFLLTRRSHVDSRPASVELSTRETVATSTSAPTVADIPTEISIAAAPTQPIPAGGVTNQGSDTSVAIDTTITRIFTVTPFPTKTPRPTFTPLPTKPPESTRTASPTPLSSEPPATPAATFTATNAQPVCQQTPGPRWGPTLWDRNKNILGCALTDEIRTTAAYQYYQNGLAVWREDLDRVYFLYYNDRSYAVFPAQGPRNYYASDWVKGSFGYIWTSNEAVRNRLGPAEAAEFNATNFAVQDFAGGTIFYFLENEARNYVLFSNSSTWTSAQE